MKENVEKAIERVKMILAAEGGSIELVEIDEANKIVKVRLTGACGSCPFSAMTLKNVAEKTIKEEAPEVKEVRLA